MNYSESTPKVIDTAELPLTESLTVEFKSDTKKLSDADLIEAVVCLANADGGAIYLGVEDDGSVTGLHPSRRTPIGLPAMVANRTRPPVGVGIESLSVDDHPVLRIDVPKATTSIIATVDGMVKQRRVGADGKPECVPLLPQDFTSRLSSLGALDPSGQAVPNATLEDLDPAERARLRQFVERFKGDAKLGVLSDDELDGALALTVRKDGKCVPTLAGLLLIGKERALVELVPTHELAFQVLEGEKVKLNEFSRAPLLRLFEWVENLFTPLNPEQEMQVGLFRVPVPRVDRMSFREALANALTHRDYARMGAVHVRFEADSLVISNPGGFVEGVTLANLLTTEPRPRNRNLAHQCLSSYAFRLRRQISLSCGLWWTRRTSSEANSLSTA